MPLVSPLPAAEQAVLIWSFLGAPRNFSTDDARKVVEQLTPGNEQSVARQLKTLLVEAGQKVKHVHCLELAAKLAGRRGWHDGHPKAAFELHFANFAGIEQESRSYSRFADLAERIAEAVQGHVQCYRSVFVGSVTRGQQGLILQLPSGSGLPALAVVNQVDQDGHAAWADGMPMLLERVRRLVEEAGAPGFLDGFFCAYHGRVGPKNCGRLVVHDGGFEIGSGNELHAFQAIERAAGGDFGAGQAEMNSVRTEKGTFFLSHVYSELEPRLEISKRTLLHPESVELLRRYRLLKQRSPGLLAELLEKAPLAYKPGHGMPEAVPLKQRVLDERLAAAGRTRAWLAGEAGVPEAALEWPLGVDAFIQVAKTLGLQDYNELVGVLPYQEAAIADDAEFLQTVLNDVDDVRFILRKGIPDEALHDVREACNELATSRHLLIMNRAGKLNGVDGGEEGLDEVVFSTDADEFLSAIHARDCTARVVVVPAFYHAPQVQELPGVGRRAMVYIAAA